VSKKRPSKKESFSFAERAAPTPTPKVTPRAGKEVLEKIFEHWCLKCNPPKKTTKKKASVGNPREKKGEEVVPPRLPEWAFLKLCRVSRLPSDDHVLADYASIYHIAKGTPQSGGGEEGEGLTYEGFRIAMHLVGDTLYGEGYLNEPVGFGASGLALGNSVATGKVLADHVLAHGAISPHDPCLDSLCSSAMQRTIQEWMVPLRLVYATYSDLAQACPPWQEGLSEERPLQVAWEVWLSSKSLGQEKDRFSRGAPAHRGAQQALGGISMEAVWWCFEDMSADEFENDLVALRGRRQAMEGLELPGIGTMGARKLSAEDMAQAFAAAVGCRNHVDILRKEWLCFDGWIEMCIRCLTTVLEPVLGKSFSERAEQLSVAFHTLLTCVFQVSTPNRCGERVEEHTSTAMVYMKRHNWSSLFNGWLVEGMNGMELPLGREAEPKESGKSHGLPSPHPLGLLSAFEVSINKSVVEKKQCASASQSRNRRDASPSLMRRQGLSTSTSRSSTRGGSAVFSSRSMSMSAPRQTRDKEAPNAGEVQYAGTVVSGTESCCSTGHPDTITARLASYLQESPSPNPNPNPNPSFLSTGKS